MTPIALAEPQLAAAQRRTVVVLAVGQILGGVAAGATLSIGAVLAARLAGDAWSGAAATMSTLGAAAAAIPLARLANRAGRRAALTLGILLAASGALVTVVAAGLASFPLLLVGYALLGVGTAVNLQSRFAATDAADPARRGRDLSLVVWSTTIGAVLGPNLFAPGEIIAEALGMPALTGSFAIGVVTQLIAAAVYLVGLRPDPLALALARPVLAERVDAGGIRTRSLLVFSVAATALSHAVMVAVMAMTPVHLTHQGASLTIVGVTISLHVAGMFALSPVFGWLSDRIGRVPVILLGQGLVGASLAVLALGADGTLAVTVGLVLLGLGWSAATVSGSALVADLVSGAARTRIQGRADLVMSLAGAVGGASAGPVLALVGYAGLAVVSAAPVLAVVVAAVLLAPRAKAALTA